MKSSVAIVAMPVVISDARVVRAVVPRIELGLDFLKTRKATMNFLRRFNCWGFFFAYVFCASICSAQSTNDELNRFRDCAISNAECWKQFDVLMKIHYFSPNDEGDKSVLTRHIRLAIDFEKQTMFCCDLWEKFLEQNRTSVLSVVISDGKRAHLKRYPGEDQNMIPILLSLLSATNAPDLRCVGITSFPKPFIKQGVKNQSSFESLVKRRNGSLEMQENPFPVLRTMESVNEIRFVRKNEGSGITASESFDPKTLMPRRYLATGNREPVSLAERDENYEWKSINGLYVPIAISCEKGPLVMRETESGRKPIRIQTIIDASIHWFSLNEKLDTTLIDFELIKDVNRLRSLVDPVKTGADSLVDKTN
jgi:hypothetical protein